MLAQAPFILTLWNRSYRHPFPPLGDRDPVRPFALRWLEILGLRFYGYSTVIEYELRPSVHTVCTVPLCRIFLLLSLFYTTPPARIRSNVHAVAHIHLYPPD